MYISSSVALLLYSGLMIGAYVFSSLIPDTPFLEFATQFTIGFVAYITKRLIQKNPKYNSAS